MRIRTWWSRREWLYGAALASALLVPSAGHAWIGEPPGFSLRAADDSLRLGALPPPPEPPAAPLPAASSSSGAPDREHRVFPPRPDPAASLDWSDPIFDDPRSEASINLTPGLPVPRYPIVVTPPVEALIDIFRGRDRERFGTWIARSGRYLAMIQQVFRERGLPEDLAYTAMIESGFSPWAVSRVGATGMWQFMDGTARRYGLLVNRWVDERQDPVKATVAAARYLTDLYEMFGHWFLAQAAYNAGEARVEKAIQRAGTSDFWALTQTRHLPDETKLFVPQILAAAVITREPERYGFDVTKEAPLAYDEVTVKRPLDLQTVADLAGISVAAVRELNPALVARVTPPEGYPLRLPVGAGDRFEAALRATPASRLTTWGIHRVGRNQSLAEIARLYRITAQRLVEVNRLSSARLRGVAELIVPISNRVAPAVASAPAAAAARVAAPARSSPPTRKEVVVRRGDTLGAIAARYGLKPMVLARLNGMEPEGRLLPGARLRVGPR